MLRSLLQVLIIDDDPAIQLLLKRTLLGQGYKVAVASDGEEGLKKAQELHPALIICDWVMPKMNGLEVCRKIKATRELSTTFFILLTALGSVEDRVKGLDAGADDFLCKPIDMNELKARVRAGIRLHQLSRDLQQQKLLLEAELAEAADYVRSVLPEPMYEPPVSISSRFIPSRQLGGDGFDYYWLDEEHLAIYLLDIAGHGLRAALPSLSVLSLLRNQTHPQINYYQPSSVLKGLNESFQITQRNDKYFTIWYGVYNQVTSQIIYASAGHPPAILFSGHPGAKTQTQRLKTPGLPIGMFPESEYVDAECEIKPGSTLYIFSDGIYEINQADATIWGIESLINLFGECRKTDTQNLDKILAYVQNINSKDYFNDDLSLLEVNFNGSEV